jgi:pyruvate/2-oxoglutarate dehydrogenase complex dihydrolipoamide dehydrogenase (E3) component
MLPCLVSLGPTLLKHPPLQHLIHKVAMSYSAIVIGSGQAGGPLATAFAKAGHKTALVEESHIGGTCVNEGCTPTKTMVASARVAYLAGRGRDYGIEIDKPFTMNMETVRKRKRDIVDSFRGGNEARLKRQENLDLYMGKAKFVGKKDIEITLNGFGEKKTINGETILINAGCRPAPLTIPGADQIEVLNSTTVMELDSVPAHLVVIGGGYVGIEFAQMFRRFGSAVTVIQRSGQLLGKEDPDIADAVKSILIEDGLEILLNTKPLSVSKSDSGSISLEVSAGQTTKKLTSSHILAAAGRNPNTHSLDVSIPGISTYGPGFIKTNEHLETNVPGIYALGDIKGGPQFTHISYDDFRIIRHNLITNASKVPLGIKDRLVPYTVFMDPQLGRIGLTETEARTRHSPTGGEPKNIRVAKMPMGWVARALEVDESRGMMKAIVDDDTKQILGFACLGIEGGEVMSMVQIAMMGGVRYDQLADAVFAHPCLSESLNNLWANLE